MSARIEYLKKEIRVVLDGEIDHHSASLIRISIDDAIIHKRPQTLILDFSKVSFMDSSGIGVILGRYRQMRDRGGQLGVIHMNRHIARIFHMSGMDRVIRQLDNPQEAAKA